MRRVYQPRYGPLRFLPIGLPAPRPPRPLRSRASLALCILRPRYPCVLASRFPAAPARAAALVPARVRTPKKLLTARAVIDRRPVNTVVQRNWAIGPEPVGRSPAATQRRAGHLPSLRPFNRPAIIRTTSSVPMRWGRHSSSSSHIPFRENSSRSAISFPAPTARGRLRDPNTEPIVVRGNLHAAAGGSTNATIASGRKPGGGSPIYPTPDGGRFLVRRPNRAEFSKQIQKPPGRRNGSSVIDARETNYGC